MSDASHRWILSVGLLLLVPLTTVLWLRTKEPEEEGKGVLVDSSSATREEAGIRWNDSHESREGTSESYEIRLRSLLRSTDQSAQDMIVVLFEECATRNPEKALALTALLPKDSEALALAAWDGLIRGWGGRDPRSLLLWASANLEGTLRESAITAGAEALANSDPESAVKWLSASLSGDDRDQALGMALETWVDRSPEAAVDWVQAESDWRHAAQIGGHWAQKDPVKAAKWTENILDDPARKQTRLAVIEQWATTPAEAAAWIATLPPNEAAPLVVALQDQIIAIQKARDLEHRGE